LLEGDFGESRREDSNPQPAVYKSPGWPSVTISPRLTLCRNVPSRRVIRSGVVDRRCRSVPSQRSLWRPDGGQRGGQPGVKRWWCPSPRYRPGSDSEAVAAAVRHGVVWLHLHGPDARQQCAASKQARVAIQAPILGDRLKRRSPAVGRRGWHVTGGTSPRPQRLIASLPRGPWSTIQ
jgi:hypothetical protein